MGGLVPPTRPSDSVGARASASHGSHAVAIAGEGEGDKQTRVSTLAARTGAQRRDGGGGARPFGLVVVAGVPHQLAEQIEQSLPALASTALMIALKFGAFR